MRSCETWREGPVKGAIWVLGDGVQFAGACCAHGAALLLAIAAQDSPAVQPLLTQTWRVPKPSRDTQQPGHILSTWSIDHFDMAKQKQANAQHYWAAAPGEAQGVEKTARAAFIPMPPVS